jgi:hypothetical protein
LGRLFPNRIPEELWNWLAPIIYKPASWNHESIGVALAQHACVMRTISVAGFKPHQLLTEHNAIENAGGVATTWALAVTTHH